MVPWQRGQGKEVGLLFGHAHPILDARWSRWPTNRSHCKPGKHNADCAIYREVGFIGMCYFHLEQACINNAQLLPANKEDLPGAMRCFNQLAACSPEFFPRAWTTVRDHGLDQVADILRDLLGALARRMERRAPGSCFTAHERRSGGPVAPASPAGQGRGWSENHDWSSSRPPDSTLS